MHAVGSFFGVSGTYAEFLDLRVALSREACTLDLAAGGLRKRFDEEHVLGDLDSADLAAAEVPDVFLRDFLPACRMMKAPTSSPYLTLVMPATWTSLTPSIVYRNSSISFGYTFSSAADDHVLDAAGDREIAPRVLDSEVSRMKPAHRIDDFSRSPRASYSSLHAVVAAAAEFAVDADRTLFVWSRGCGRSPPRRGARGRQYRP